MYEIEEVYPSSPARPRDDRQGVWQELDSPRGQYPTTSACARRRRPRPLITHAHRRRRHPGNEGRGYVLRRCCAARCVRCDCWASRIHASPNSLPVSLERMKQSLPPVGDRFRPASPRLRMPRRMPSGARSPRARRSSTLPSRGPSPKGVASCRRPGVRAPRHPWLPDRPHSRDGPGAGPEVDREGFTRLMQEQRERAKADAKGAKKSGHATTEVWKDLRALGATEGRGGVDLGGDCCRTGRRRRACRGTRARQRGQVILDRTPSTPNPGGQIADDGVISSDGAHLKVVDVQRPIRASSPTRLGSPPARSGSWLARSRRGRRGVAAVGLPGATQALTWSTRPCVPVLGPSALQSGSLQQAGLPSSRFRLEPWAVRCHAQRD